MGYAAVGTVASNPNKSGTNISMTMPSFNVGDLLLLCGTLIDTAGFSVTGWQSICSVFSASGAAQSAVWGKVTVGGDTATMVAGSGTSKNGSCLIYPISNWSGNINEVTGVATNGGGVTAAPNPPNLTGVPPRDNTWFAVGAGSTTPSMTAPSGYGNLSTALYNSSASTLAVARRQTTGTSEDPGAFGGSLGNPMGLTVVVPGLGTAGLLPFFGGLAHHDELDDELAARRYRRRASGLRVPARRFTVARAA